jgi:hypothetical protein
MDEVWNRKYERGPIRIDSILSIYARMAPQERAVHIGWIDAGKKRSSRTARKSLRRRPGKNLCSLARTAQSAINRRMISPFDPAHGAPELPEASGSCPLDLAFSSFPPDDVCGRGCRCHSSTDASATSTSRIRHRRRTWSRGVTMRVCLLSLSRTVRLPLPHFRCPYFRFHTFGFVIPYPTSAQSLPGRMFARLSSGVAAGGTRAHVHSHRVLTGAMRGGHAAPALGGFTLSVGTSPRPQVPLSSWLSVPVAMQPVAARPGSWSIWVRRVTCFFPGDFRPPCAGNPQRVAPKPCSAPGLGAVCMTMASPQPGSIVTVLVSEAVWRRYDRIFWFRSNPSPAAREPLCAGPRPTGPVVLCSSRVCHSTWRQASRAPG